MSAVARTGAPLRPDYRNGTRNTSPGRTWKESSELTATTRSTMAARCGPFAPGATGNVVFEDLVFLCESKGFATGIDIGKLVAVRAILRSEMPDEQLYGGLARAGLPRPTSVAA